MTGQGAGRVDGRVKPGHDIMFLELASVPIKYA